MEVRGGGSEEQGRGSGGVELGFAERPAPSGVSLSSQCWGDWDGGKLGGRPLWLTLRGLPPPASLQCSLCSRPMVLLAQVYAPLDEVPEAYHRALYVLCCPSGACVNVAGSAGGVLVLRSQLPRVTPELPYLAEEVIERPAWEGSPDSPLCCLCGCPAPSRCARCKGPRYCSKAHQLAHWRLGHKAECSAEGGGAGAPAPPTPALAMRAGAMLAEWDVDIEEEPSLQERALHAEHSLPPEASKALKAIRQGKAAEESASASASSSASSEAGNAGEGEEGELSITGLTQKELNEAVGTAPAADAALVEFEVRTSCAQSQVLRYSGWWPNPPPVAAGAAAVAASAAAKPAAADGAQMPLSGGGAGSGAAVEGGSGGAEAETEAAAEAEAAAAEAAAAEAAAAAEEEAEEGFAEGPGVPLWFSTPHQPAASDIPPCPACGAARVFELQIMPQALHYVLQAPSEGGGGEEGAASVDFGTLAVYTCPRSCALGEGGALARELAWVQPSGELRGAGAGGVS